MPETTFITIQDASGLSGKSVQTIRRAIKAKRLTCKRKKTPQGFNYMLNRDSVLKFYKIKPEVLDRRAAGLKQTQIEDHLAKEFATLKDLQSIQKDMEELIEEHKKAKDSFVRFMKVFQEKFVVLENQLKLLEQPKQKKWFQVWK
jgi:hypothetical protein